MLMSGPQVDVMRMKFAVDTIAPGTYLQLMPVKYIGKRIEFQNTSCATGIIRN
jgi:hypothetical protein